jgi:glutamyl-tRNA synthetase
MSLTVRFAPSPTGFLHIGGVRTALFNWLAARHGEGEFRLRIENTDTSREVAEATGQIEDSLRWLGLDWDGEVTFQLDRIERAQQEAQRLLAEGKAYEDDGAIRIKMPDEGVTAWDDLIRGRVEFQNDALDDLIILRSDGRPTYNFASPLEDWLDGVTHVIRADDHVSNTPKQIKVLEALGAEPPRYAHCGMVLGEDGAKLSKRHGAVGVDEFRREGYIPEALVNYLALLGWSFDDKTTVMTRAELVERFSLERVQPSAATFDYDKLRWLNGVHLRELAPAAYAEALVAYVHEQRPGWDEATVRAAAPLCQEKLTLLGEFFDYTRFLFEDVEAGGPVDPELVAAARAALAPLDPFAAPAIEEALRLLPEQLGRKPRDVFGAIRLAITGAKVSPSLFESIELVGRETALSRLDAAAA